METVPAKNNLKYLWAFLSSVAITLFLFYIDEGYYNFEWMKRAGNWVPFVVYVFVIYGLIIFFGRIIRRKKQ
jgi:hypothetical protein